MRAASVHQENEPPARVTVARPEPIPAPAPAPEVVPAAPVPEPPEEPLAPEGMGLLEVGSVQPGYEVYIDGNYVRPQAGGQAYPAGRHAVAIVASDGRRKVFTVELADGERLRRTWDFERLEWR